MFCYLSTKLNHNVYATWALLLFGFGFTKRAFRHADKWAAKPMNTWQYQAAIEFYAWQDKYPLCPNCTWPVIPGKTHPHCEDAFREQLFTELYRDTEQTLALVPNWTVEDEQWMHSKYHGLNLESIEHVRVLTDAAPITFRPLKWADSVHRADEVIHLDAFDRINREFQTSREQLRINERPPVGWEQLP